MFTKFKQDKLQRLSEKRNSRSSIWTKLDFCPSVVANLLAVSTREALAWQVVRYILRLARLGED